MSGHGVLANFPILVNGSKQQIFRFYREFDSAEQYQTQSVNFNITATDTKLITTVIRNSVLKNLSLFILKSGRTLECTIDHPVPVLRVTSTGPEMRLLTANQIMTGDSLYYISDDAINIDLVEMVGGSDFSGSVYGINLAPNDEEHDDGYFVNADTGIILHV